MQRLTRRWDVVLFAERFNIGKTAAADIFKNAKQLRADYESFKGTYKKRRHGRYHLINEALYKWYKRCTAANIYPDGALLQEEALIIKDALGKDELDDFNDSNGCLQRWKDNYGIRERRICVEGDDVPVITVHAWIERLPEITQGYALCDIWNMDELGLFFKALPEKGHAEKSISAKGGKKCKQRYTVAIFVAADGSKVTNSVLVGRSRKPNCFGNLKDITRPLNTHYFNYEKSWMNTEIM